MEQASIDRLSEVQLLQLEAQIAESRRKRGEVNIWEVTLQVSVIPHHHEEDHLLHPTNLKRYFRNDLTGIVNRDLNLTDPESVSIAGIVLTTGVEAPFFRTPDECATMTWSAV